MSKPSSYKTTDLNFNLNEDHNRELLRKLRYRLQKVALGGGEKSIAKHKAKGKLTARERINLLLDDKDEKSLFEEGLSNSNDSVNNLELLLNNETKLAE